MNHEREGRRPGDDARPYLPTEIEPPHLPTEMEAPYPPPAGARPFLPTEIEPPYPPRYEGEAYQPTHTGVGEPRTAGPSYIPSHARPTGQPAQAGPAPELTRYGPGVPATSPPAAAHTAERIWRTGQADQPPRRLRRWRGLARSALTVILLAASGVVLYLRFHHTPFHVTGVAITQQTQSRCGVKLTGQIRTNGAAGTVSYQWLFQPGQQTPQPLTQSVSAGRNTVDVTVAVQGSGRGSASRTVTLQILDPDSQADSTSVILRC
jgi:hypothetical protein